MSTPFTIVQVSWLTRLSGNEDRRDEIVEHIYRIAKFLQDNELTVSPLIEGRHSITDDFSISSSDLTEEGMALMRSSYDKWLTKVDNEMSPENLTILEKALNRLRAH